MSRAPTSVAPSVPRMGAINLSLAELHAWKNGLPPEIRGDRGQFLFTLSGYIIAAFTSLDWVKENMLANSFGTTSEQGFLQVDPSGDIARETKYLRMLELAEILLNLQGVEGFDDCVERMKTGDANQIEATVAELEFAKLLRMHDIDFKFVVPDRIAGGRNYDFELTLATNPVVCADVKCKLESTDIDPLSVRNTLSAGRRQLPRDQPGILYVKVPQHWFERPEMAEELRRIAQGFLRSTARVVMVCYYLSHLRFDTVRQETTHQHAFDEIVNPSSRFPHRDWRLFSNFTPPADWVDGLPPTWVWLKSL
jgi:hypothetical protein